MIDIIKRSIKEPEVKKLKKFSPGSWVHAEDPSVKEQERLVKDLGLDKDLLGDALDMYEVPRIEVEGKDIYIFTRVPYNDGSRSWTIPVLIVHKDKYVVTVSRKKVLFDEELLSKTNLYTTQKTKLILQLFSEIHRLYNHFLMNITKTVRSTSVDIETIDNKDIIKLLRYETTINDFMGALMPMKSILDNILSGKTLELYENDRDLVEDLSLSTNQLIELGGATMKNIVNIREVYSTIMTNNLNRVIKLLTSLTVILTVPMIVTSFYGMNVKLPFANSPLAHLEIAGGTIILSLFMLFIFIRKKWL